MKNKKSVQDDFLESLKLIGSKPGFERLNSKLGLERIKFLLEKSGRRWEDIPVVHVAGTNGKGSVVTFISNILSESDYKVGTYVSPHLLEIYERIKIGDQYISPKDFDRILSEIKPYCKEAENITEIGSPTFFEILTVMAIIYFSDNKVDVIVSEVGLGGRLDATNVLNGKAVAITNISFDHQEILGDTLEQILIEKAGIIKKDSIVSSCIDSELTKLLEKICIEKGASLRLLGRDFEIIEKKIGKDKSIFDYASCDNSFSNIKIRMLGRHQIINAACAISLAETMIKFGFEISEKNIREGLEKSSWPGRIQILKKNPTVIVDVAHNIAGAKSLSENYNKLFNNSKTVLLVGISSDKDIDGILNEFSKISKKIILTTLPPRCANISILEEKARKYFTNIKSFEDPLDAFDFSMSNLNKDETLLLTGSIYIAGYILKGKGLIGS